MICGWIELFYYYYSYRVYIENRLDGLDICLQRVSLANPLTLLCCLHALTVYLVLYPH